MTPKKVSNICRSLEKNKNKNIENLVGADKDTIFHIGNLKKIYYI